MGVIDGHDVRALRRALREALAAERPVVVHCATVKGKGFAPAEEGGLEGMEKWHAAKPKSIANGAPAPRPPRPRAGAKPPPPQYTQVFGEALVRECRRDERVIGITAAMNSGTGPQHPPARAARPLLRRRDRRAAGGPVRRRARAPGLPSRSRRSTRPSCSARIDQIVHDVCLQRLNVVFAMDRAGLVGDDGPTHHGAFDIAYLRCLPNIVLMAPARRGDARAHAAHRARLRRRPGRAALPARRGGRGRRCRLAPKPIAIGTGEILREGGAPLTAAAGSRCSATAPASARRSRPPTSSPTTGSRRPSPTRASPSRSTPGSRPSLRPSTTCS